eukprot:13560016-Ditylum_brightwellii.AAC.1
MKRTEIMVNTKNACDAMNNWSKVQPSMIPRPHCIPPVQIQALPILHTGQGSQVLCSANDQYTTDGVTAHSVRLGLEQVNKNDSSSSDEDYHQSNDRDHYSELKEVTSDSGEEDLEDPNCLKLPHYLVKETVKGQKDFFMEDIYEEK